MNSVKLVGLAAVLTAACGMPGETTGEQLETSADQLYVLTTVLWPGGNVPVCWESAGLDLEKSWVRSVIARTWENAAQVSFTGWTLCPSTSFDGVRVRWADVPPLTRGLGTQVRGVVNGVTLNATFGSWSTACRATESRRQDCIEANAVHEFGHVLGFADEQNRPDTPSTCTQPPQGPNGNQMYGAWDRASVMNRCNYTLNNARLSATDTAGVARYYGGPMCDGAPTSWAGCRGSGCTPCTEKLTDYPLYTFNHPKCTLNPTCGGEYHQCSDNCPAPTASDACSLLLGNWRGCGGNGCSVCKEKLALYPNYLRRHPKCTLNESCGFTAIACSATCPAPTDLDK